MSLRWTFCFFLLSIAFTAATAQQPNGSRDEQIVAMKRLSNMSGTWSGSGWMQMGPSEKRESIVTETVQPKLDGLLLVVDGLGKNSSGQVVHQAFGVLSFDPVAKGYKFATYVKEGHSMIADARLEGDNLVWGFDTPNGSIRYTITITPTEWIEIGERSTDKQTWRKFFEMKLKKQS